MKQRVSKGEKYYWIGIDGKIYNSVDFYTGMDAKLYELGNYFLTKEIAELMAHRLQAVLKGAKVIEKVKGISKNIIN